VTTRLHTSCTQRTEPTSQRPTALLQHNNGTFATPSIPLQWAALRMLCHCRPCSQPCGASD
jgi:hypothetical protein